MKLCSRHFVLYCRSRPKDDKSRHFDPHFEEVRGGVEPWRMARWKARTEFFLSVIELIFSISYGWGATKCVKTRCLQEWVGHLEPKFQGEGVVRGEYFLVPTKLDTFCYPTCKLHRATCRRFDTIPRVKDRRTDGRTDGIAVANTALAMRALRRAVKTRFAAVDK